MTNLADQLRAAVESYVTTDDNYKSIYYCKDIQPLIEKMIACVEAAENVRCSRYPERSGIPALEQTLAALQAEVERMGT